MFTFSQQMLPKAIEQELRICDSRRCELRKMFAQDCHTSALPVSGLFSINMRGGKISEGRQRRYEWGGEDWKRHYGRTAQG
jgi:hypothetical protein